MDERGIDLLLLVALQVSVERTSFLPKFLITSSFRATPFLTVTVLLLTSLSSLYQDTVGVGLPATMEKKKKRKKDHVSRQISKLFLSLSIPYSPIEDIFYSLFLKGSSDWDDFFFLLFSLFFCPLLLETYGFVRSFHHRFFNSFSRYDEFCEEKLRLYREVYEWGELKWIATLLTGDISCLLLYSVSGVRENYIVVIDIARISYLSEAVIIIILSINYKY